MTKPNPTLASNRKARREYHVAETLEAGMVLTGTEVKAARRGRVSLVDAYCKVRGLELFLVGAHIAPYSHGNLNNHDPLRERKLLLHRQQIRSLKKDTEQKGFTVIPLRMYLSGGIIKLEIGVARGKRLYDKRKEVAERDMKRHLNRTLKQY